MSREECSNVVAYLRDATERFPGRPALVLDGKHAESISFGELWERVDRFSAGLIRNGLHPGSRAICMVPMSIDLYVCLLGLLKMGAVAVFVDPWIGARQIAAFCAYASPSAYIGVPKSHLLRLLDSRLRRIPLTVTTGGKLLGLLGRFSLRELEQQLGDGLLHPSREDDPALITFTSGSSGTPKGANRTHGFLAAQHEALAGEFAYDDDDVDMPMFPVFALGNLAKGITSVVPAMDFKAVSRVDGSVIVEQMLRHRVTTCTASPPFFDRLAEHLLGAGSQRPRLRRILTGGAPVADDQLRRWRDALPDTEIMVVYGSTEAEPVAHIEAGERFEVHRIAGESRRGFCVGRPAACVETRVIRIHDGPVELAAAGWDGWCVGAGKIGELVVAGNHVCRDYYENPDAVARNKIVDGDRVWHRMGDTGFFDDDGRFWIVGRTHSTIRRAGVCVHPQWVERVAAEGTKWQVAAVGCEDEALGQKVVLVVFPRGDTFDRASLRARLGRGGVEVDDIVVVNKALPVDPRHNAKIDYGALRRRIEEGRYLA
jgi:olefin beta-lactone synthetase